MPDPNPLTEALKGSLEAIDSGTESPLSEATPDSVDILLDRIKDHLVAGMPEKISDSDLLQAVRIYRAQALKWGQEEQKKREAGPRKRRSTVEAIDISDLLNEEPGK